MTKLGAARGIFIYLVILAIPAPARAQAEDGGSGTGTGSGDLRSVDPVSSRSDSNPAPSGGLGVLPFRTAETAAGTTDSLVLTLRHRVEFDRTANTVTWEQLEAELPERIRVSVAPGQYSLDEATTNTAQIRIDVVDGYLEAEPRLIGAEDFDIPFSLKLEPRDIDWTTPPIEGRGIAVEADFAIDSALADANLPLLARLDLRSLKFDRLHAGLYEIENFAMQGHWDEPEFRLESLRANVFGGELTISGHGRWGTDEDLRLSVDMQVEGVDLTEMLVAFAIPRAAEIRATISGSLHLETLGREWRKLDLDVHGHEGTVYLSRPLLYDILGERFGAGVPRPVIDVTLDGVFGGDEDMIPFREMAFQGSLAGDKLRLVLPLRNDALDILIEPRVDRGLLWDIWDRLVEAAAKNIRADGVKIEKAEPSGLDDTQTD